MTPQLQPESQPLSCAALPSGGRRGSGPSWRARGQRLRACLQDLRGDARPAERTCACAPRSARWRQRIRAASLIALLFLALSRRLRAPFPASGRTQTPHRGAEARVGAETHAPWGARPPSAGPLVPELPPPLLGLRSPLRKTGFGSDYFLAPFQIRCFMLQCLDFSSSLGNTP